jgi:hypothetical protein
MMDEVQNPSNSGCSELFDGVEELKEIIELQLTSVGNV